MRARMPPETIAQWLGLAPEVLYQSVAMQGLFGIGLWGGAPKRPLPISRSLGVLLKMGRVKLQAQPGQSGYHIDDCMPGAHEYLAFSCAKYFNDGYLGWYAKQYWSQHLKHAEPSERLFETLRRVVIRGCDIEPVIQWLEESPGVPEDILARWRAAQVDPGITDVSTIDDRNSNPKLGCHLDRAFQERLDRLAWARRIDGDGEP
ncbi:hypothetical protein BD779DRAFT_282951 [Infundibulicybe gibba]|nr:hypothetical protein BD779DRAFT_282951 [Infundibulicybe gibba]